MVSAKRAIVTSTQLSPSYEAGYFLDSRARMFASLQAYYGRSANGIAELRTRYGATHLWVKRDAVRDEMARNEEHRWHGGRQPYARFVRRLLAAGEPAVLRLPAACRRWHAGTQAIYDIACIATTSERAENRA